MIRCPHSYMDGFNTALSEILTPIEQMKKEYPQEYKTLRPLVNFINSLKVGNIDFHFINTNDGYIPVVVSSYTNMYEVFPQLQKMDKKYIDVAPTISTQDMDKVPCKS